MELKPTVPPTPLSAYQPPAAHFDEYCDASGQVRPPWRSIAPFLDSLGGKGIAACEAEAGRLLKESGATFFASDQGGGQPRPWQLSVVPLVVDADTWETVEAGLKQRIRVLEAVLDDLLGEQRLLREKVIPASLLSGNPLFLRAYHGLPFQGKHRLQVTATDLARDSDGSWWVTGDRTRAPSGLGYLLENRIVTSRVLPRLIRQSNVKRLAPFFSSLRNQLNSLAPRMRDNPRVAILTPGEQSYRYFEDTYLARYLGYTLAQGRDLAVRNGRLSLKTLGGLLPVEVLWRHISDQKCDPLELDPAATQGVTGLLRTIRMGKVAVANSIGSTLAQTPALFPFLPAAARFLFKQDLTLPSIPTHWCGTEEGRKLVLSRLDDMLVRPAFSVSGAAPIRPGELSAAARAELVDAIQASPQEFIAHPPPARSSTPVWSDGQMRPWNVALRTFHVQTDEGVEVLPGGLSRVSPQAESLEGSPISGQLGQDCWVIGTNPVDADLTLLPPADAPIRLTRSGAKLPSRVAEHLFWLGRYVERSEAIARLLRTTLTRIAGENDIAQTPELPRLIAALATIGQVEPDYALREFWPNLPPLEEALPDSLYDNGQPRGLQAGVRSMIVNASAVRDSISLDAYRILSRVGDDLSDPGVEDRRDLGASIESVNRLITDLLAFAGLSIESITRSHGWRFLQLGRRIERCYQTAELLSATLTYPFDDERALMEPVLRATDSLMTYRSRYLLQLQPAAVIDLLITDETNPRSLGFQLRHIVQLLGELPVDDQECGLGEDERLAETLLHRVHLSDPYQLAVGSAGVRPLLRDLLEPTIEELPKLSDAITARYLIHTSSSQTLTGRQGPNEPNESP